MQERHTANVIHAGPIARGEHARQEPFLRQEGGSAGVACTRLGWIGHGHEVERIEPRDPDGPGRSPRSAPDSEAHRAQQRAFATLERVREQRRDAGSVDRVR